MCVMPCNKAMLKTSEGDSGDSYDAARAFLGSMRGSLGGHSTCKLRYHIVYSLCATLMMLFTVSRDCLLVQRLFIGAE